MRFVVVKGALPAHPVGYRVIQRHRTSTRVVMLALRVIQGSTARRSEIRAPEKHVGADPRSGVYPTEPGDPGWVQVFGKGSRVWGTRGELDAWPQGKDVCVGLMVSMQAAVGVKGASWAHFRRPWKNCGLTCQSLPSFLGGRPARSAGFLSISHSVRNPHRPCLCSIKKPHYTPCQV